MTKIINLRVYWLVLEHGTNAQNVLTRQNGP